jgi:serine/threonine protein phosphatase PrpC
VLAVADGLGGSAAGEHAARLALEALIEAVEGVAAEDIQLRTAILNGLEAANARILALGTGAATTLAVVELTESTVRPYHVGDSLILLVGGRGKLKLQTIPHSPVGYGVEAGLLDEGDAMHHEDRHIVSNVVGHAEMRIEIGSPLTLAKRDTLLLASDGLADNLHVNEIAERLAKGTLSRASEQLATDATERMVQPSSECPSKADDLTFIAFRRTPAIGNAGPP